MSIAHPTPRQFITNQRERTRFFRFLVVGAIGAVVDFGVMNLLTQLLHFRLVLAGTISFIAAVLSNFTWNRYWTYPDSRSKPLAQQLGQFTLVSVTGLLIRVPILAVLEPPMHHLFERVLTVLPWLLSLTGTGNTTQAINFYAKNFTLAIAVIIVLFWNFFANRFWTYSDV